MVSFLAMCPEDLSCFVYSEFLTVKCLTVLDSGFCCTSERPEFLALIASVKCVVKAKVDGKSEIEWVLLKQIRIKYLVLIGEEFDVSLLNYTTLIHLETRGIFDPRICDIIHRNPLQIIDLDDQDQTHLNTEFTDGCLFESTCRQNLRALRLHVNNTVTLQVITRIINMCPNLNACEIKQYGGHPLGIVAFGQEWVGNFARESELIGLPPTCDSCIKMRLRMTRKAFNQTRDEFNAGLLGLIACMGRKQVKEMWINSEGQLGSVLQHIARYMKDLTHINIECKVGLKVKESDMEEMKRILMSCTHLNKDKGIFILHIM